MSNLTVKLDIQRIVLSGLDLAPDRLNHIQKLVSLELQILLERQGQINTLPRGEVRHLQLPRIDLVDPQNDNLLAGTLAQSIAQALRISST